MGKAEAKPTPGVRRCVHGQPVAVDGSGCSRCGLKPKLETICRSCGSPIDKVLTAAGIDLHPNCPEPEPAPWVGE